MTDNPLQLHPNGEIGFNLPIKGLHIGLISVNLDSIMEISQAIETHIELLAEEKAKQMFFQDMDPKDKEILSMGVRRGLAVLKDDPLVEDMADIRRLSELIVELGL